jgi:ribosomal protein L14
MHILNNIECIDAQGAKAIHNLKNTKQKLCRTNAAICNTCILEFENSKS